MSTKLLLLIALSLLVRLPLAAQSPNYLWAKQAGGTNIDRAQNICTDPAGNVIIVGWSYSHPISFDSLSIPTGSDRLFIAKYDPAGNILWVRSGTGGTSVDELFGVTTDAASNVIVTGMLANGQAIFGTDTIRKLPLGSGDNAFIVKYDANGNELWARASSGMSVQAGLSVSTDAGNNIFMSGRFAAYPATFGTLVLNSAGPGYNSFLIKYDPAGNVIWGRRSSGTAYTTEAYGVSADTHGNAVIAGDFFGSSAPCSTIFDTITISGGNSQDLFVAKYNNSGDILWARSVGGDCASVASSVSTDAADNIYVTGWFGYGTYISFGSTVLSNSGLWNIFIAKYDPAGNLLWVKNPASTSDDRANAICADAAGNTFIAGRFSSPTITFGSTVLTNSSSGGSTTDMFIAKYDAAGNAVWAKNPYGNDADEAFGICTDATGKTYITGDFASPALIFGADTLSCASPAYQDIFLVKIDDKLETGISENENDIDLTIYPNPGKGIFSISATAKILQADVVNMLGEVIYSEKINSRQADIDLSAVARGVYFIRVYTAKGITGKKISITR